MAGAITVGPRWPDWSGAGNWGLRGRDWQPGDRIAFGLRNGVDWVCCDQAALGLGLVPVPLYTTDNPENLAHILADSGARLLLLDSDLGWSGLAPGRAAFPQLQRVLCLTRQTVTPDDCIRTLADWLPRESAGLRDLVQDPGALATIVYTSGTTGRSKGVMQSHHGILWTAEAVLRRVPSRPTDCFLSFCRSPTALSEPWAITCR